MNEIAAESSAALSIHAQEAAREGECQRSILDLSLGGTLVIIAGVCLSFYTLREERRRLCLSLAGESECLSGLPDLFYIKRLSGAMIIGALALFCYITDSAPEPAAGEKAALFSRDSGRFAGILVLIAAIVRFCALLAAGPKAADVGESDVLV